MKDTIKIHSIYKSISGEVSSIPQGSFVTILRTSGCNCRCAWCDAPDARDGIGNEFEIEYVLDYIKLLGCKNILITGGEPLLQSEGIDKLFGESSLLNYNVIIETNGTINPFLTTFYPHVDFIVDYKMPSSGHYKDMEWDRFIMLKISDFVKFVCANEDEIKLAIKIKNDLKRMGCKAQFAIGQTWDWFIKKDFNLFHFLHNCEVNDFVLNYQLHKLLDLE